MLTYHNFFMTIFLFSQDEIIQVQSKMIHLSISMSVDPKYHKKNDKMSKE